MPHNWVSLYGSSTGVIFVGPDDIEVCCCIYESSEVSETAVFMSLFVCVCVSPVELGDVKAQPTRPRIFGDGRNWV